MPSMHQVRFALVMSLVVMLLVLEVVSAFLRPVAMCVATRALKLWWSRSSATVCSTGLPSRRSEASSASAAA